MSQESLRDLIPHPPDIDLTAEAYRRVNWPKVVLIGSLRRAYPDMVNLYREFGEGRVNALVPWGFLLNPENPWQPEDRLEDIREKFVVEAHLLRIRASDFAYVVNPDGYIGPNSTIDIGAALEAGKPVYTMAPISDSGISVMTSGIKTPEEIISIAQQTKPQILGVTQLS